MFVYFKQKYQFKVKIKYLQHKEKIVGNFMQQKFSDAVNFFFTVLLKKKFQTFLVS